MTEELDKRIREIANNYVSECWGTYLDLSDVDLVSAGIGVALEATKELQEENDRLKGDLELWESGGCRATNLFECGVVKELKDQITKAKEIIKELIKYDIPTLDYMKAEQFLKGENIILEDAQAGNSPFDADEVFHKEMKAYPEEK